MRAISSFACVIPHIILYENKLSALRDLQMQEQSADKVSVSQPLHLKDGQKKIIITKLSSMQYFSGDRVRTAFLLIVAAKKPCELDPPKIYRIFDNGSHRDTRSAQMSSQPLTCRISYR
ncbi:hypothetical protein CCR75_004283 [Bremia lactucae]|uniref:Uncharacterized protein n=1 Tax=Bremia lactucae TaxID=4779 RepID=A0A976II46_BRELC|nr:hypothetical protein CCR75_004283 [Bremia lactucae]